MHCRSGIQQLMLRASSISVPRESRARYDGQQVIPLLGAKQPTLETFQRMPPTQALELIGSLAEWQKMLRIQTQDAIISDLRALLSSAKFVLERQLLNRLIWRRRRTVRGRRRSLRQGSLTTLLRHSYRCSLSVLMCRSALHDSPRAHSEWVFSAADLCVGKLRKVKSSLSAGASPVLHRQCCSVPLRSCSLA